MLRAHPITGRNRFRTAGICPLSQVVGWALIGCATSAPSHSLVLCRVGGPAVPVMLKDEPYAAFTNQKGPNPNETIVRELLKAGVSLELCVQTLKEQG